MDLLEKILQKANELGHLLAQNEIVKRYRELAAKLDNASESRALLGDYVEALRDYDSKVRTGSVIEVEEKRKVADLEEKIRSDSILKEFLATQGYYLHLMEQVNDAIADPKGAPPKDSPIIVPGQGPRIITP